MTSGAYILASYACDVCEISMPQIADQAGAGYFGWSAEFVKDEARRHNLTPNHLRRLAEQERGISGTGSDPEVVS